MTVQRDQQVGDSSLLNTFCGFNRASLVGNSKLCQQLDSVVIESSSSQSIAIVAMDASIKNNIATSISHTHISNQPLIKMLHHPVFVTSLEAKLFAIRCSISQASSKENVSKIIIITDSIHIAKKIFDPSSHLLQSQSVYQVHKWWTQFFSILIFISFYFLIFLFLEHRVRVRSQDTKNEVEGSKTNDVIQHGHHMLASCTTHGCLGQVAQQ